MQTKEELAATRAAEEELKSRGKDAMLDAAAAAAAEVLHQAGRAVRADEQILFNLTDGRIELGES